MASDPPDAPTAAYPVDGRGGRESLCYPHRHNAEDPEGDPLQYGFRIFGDPDATQLSPRRMDFRRERNSETSWSPGSPSLPRYYWRAYAADQCSGGSTGFRVVRGHRDDRLCREGTGAGRAEPRSGGVRIVYYLPSATMSRVAIYDAQGPSCAPAGGVCPARLQVQQLGRPRSGGSTGRFRELLGSRFNAGRDTTTRLVRIE